MSLLVSVLAVGTCVNGPIAQAVDAVTLTAPANANPGDVIDLRAAMPVSSDPGTVSQTLAVTVDPGKVKLTGPEDVIAPNGWTIEYSTDGTTFSATTPADAAAWAAVRAVRATGSVVSKGAENGLQIAEGTASGNAQSTAPAFIASSGSGDGFEAFFDPGRTRVFNLYHHEQTYPVGSPMYQYQVKTLDCHVLFTGATCSGFPYELRVGTNHVSYGRIAGSKLWVTGSYDDPNDSPNQGYKIGFECIDISAVVARGGLPEPCATPWVPVGSFNMASFDPFSAYKQNYNTTIDLAGISYAGIAGNGRLWTMNALSGALYCLDTATSAPCSGMPSEGWAIAWPGGLTAAKPSNFAWGPLDASIDIWDGRVYLKAYSAGAGDWRLTCVLESDPSQSCPGFSGATSGFQSGQFRAVRKGKLVTLPAADGGTRGMCLIGSPVLCVDALGGSLTPPATLSINDALYQSYGPHPVRLGTRITYSDQSRFYCWDATRGSGAGAGCFGGEGNLAADTLTISAPYSYSFVPDPLIPDCGWGGYHPQPTLRTVNMRNGLFGTQSSPACGSLAPTRMSFAGSPVIPRMACNINPGDAAIREWRSFTLTSPALGFDNATLTVQDSSGANIPGWTNVPLPANASPPYSVDLSTLPVSTTGQNPVFIADLTNATGVNTGSATIQAVGSAPELCLQPLVLPICNQAAGLGPVDPALLVAGSTSSNGSGSANAGSGNIAFASDSQTVSIGAPTPPQCGSTLTGKATDGAGGTGAGVGGVLVTLLDAATDQPILDSNRQPITATTASDGTYSFGNLKPGNYKVSFPSSASSASVNAQTASGGASSVLTSQSAVSGTSTSGLVQLDVGTPGVVNGRYVVNPVAVADTSTGKQGAVQTITPLSNDTASTGSTYSGGSTAVKLCSSGQVAPNCTATSLVTAGEGQYSVSGTSVTFTPCSGVNTPTMTPACSGAFTGTASAVAYQSTDSAGRTASSTITPTVVPLPVATDDTSTGAWSAAQLITPLANDLRSNSYDSSHPLVAATMGICAGSTNLASSCTGTNAITTADGTYVLNTSTGVVTFTPLSTFSGVVTQPIKYAAADSLGQRVIASITPSVTPPPVPTAASETKVVNPGSTVAFTTTTGASGLATSGGPAFTTSQTFLCGVSPAETAPNCTKTSVTTSSGTYTLVQSSGVVTFAANANAPVGNQTPVTYVIKDTMGRTASATLTPVTPGPPVVAPDTYTGPWDTNQTISVLTNDYSPTLTLDPPTLALCEPPATVNCSATAVTITNEGTYSVSNGTVIFDPLPGFAANGTTTATPVYYSISDSTGQTSTSTVTPTVTAPPNPTAADETKPVLPGATVGFSPLMGVGGLSTAGGPVLSGACLVTPGSSPATCDADGVVTIPNEGTYTLDPSTKVVTYAPLASFAGTPTPMTYQVTDALGHSDTGLLTPTIPPAPSAVNDESRGEAGSPQTASLLANDSAGATSAPLDPATVMICAAGTSPCSARNDVTVSNEGTYRVNIDGTVTFTPVAGFTGQGQGISYTVSDTLGQRTSATYRPTSLPSPAPIAFPDAKSGSYGSPIDFTPLTSANASSADTAGTVPAAVTSGSSTTTVENLALDSGSLRLCAANEAPDQCTQTSVTTVDGTYVVTGATVRFTPVSTFSGTATQPVVYQVANRFDSVVIDSANTTTSSPTTTDPSATCLIANGCSITQVDDADGTAPNGTGGTVAGYTPTWTTTQALRTVTPGSKVASSTLTPTVVVPAVAAVADTATTPWNTAVTEDVLADDTFAGTTASAGSSLRLCGPSDGGVCSQTLVTITGEGTYDVVSGSVRFTPLSNFTGIASGITYGAVDGVGRRVSSTFTPTVSEPVSPTAQPDAKSLLPGATVSFAPVRANTANTRVIAGDHPVQDSATCLFTPGTASCAPSTTVVTADGTYVLDTATGIVTFTANANASPGPKMPVTYRVVDSFGMTATSTLTPTIYDAPSVPVKTGTDLVNTVQTFDSLAGVTKDASATLAPGDVRLCGPADTPPACTATTVSVAAGTFTLDLTTGVVTFTPTAGFTGSVPALTYSVTDSLGQRASGTITTSVVPLPTPAPVDDAASGNVGDTLTFQPNLNDSPGTAAASVTGLSLSPASIKLCSTTPSLESPPNCTGVSVTTVDGTYVLDPTTGAVTFTGAPGFTGTATNPVRYQISNAFMANGTPGSNTSSALLIPMITPPPSASDPTAPAPSAPVSPPVTPVVSPDPAPSAPGTATSSPPRPAAPLPAPTKNGPKAERQVDTTVVNPGQPVPLDPFAESRPSRGETFKKSSVRIWDGGDWVRTFTDPAVGTWTVENGKVMFMPVKDFIGTASINYRITDTSGAVAGNTLVVRVKARTGASAAHATPAQAPADQPGTSPMDELPKTGIPINLAIIAGIALVAGSTGSWLLRRSST